VPFFFFFSSRRRHTRSYGDWSSDVCSSDLYTIPRHCQPCRTDCSHSAETISPARRRRIHLQPRLSLEIFLATCSPSIFRQDEIRRPTRMFSLTNRRVQQIQTPPQSVNVCPPNSHKLPRRGKRSEQPDIFLCL